MTFSSYFVGSAIAPFTAGYQRVDGVVTGLVHIDSRADRQCQQNIVFTLDGKQVEGTTREPIECAKAPPMGTVLQIALEPSSPHAIHVVDPRSNAYTWPWEMGMMAIMSIALTGLYLAKAAIPYRQVRRLIAKCPIWHEVTATLKGRSQDGGRTTLLLEAENTAGQRQQFVLRHRGPSPWHPLPKVGVPFVLAMATDGGKAALLSEKNDPKLWLVQLEVPNAFELRAMGA
ncbi:hypothetical protein [Arthrobacter dokdonensis]|uniref:hypothetical protein n=1 Tax=Arthrobacter dokdonellae TaxID=2211210 RepID=UPI0014949EA5|nr:hypothetical protein [Arthrobacter dokdonellae]